MSDKGSVGAARGSSEAEQASELTRRILTVLAETDPTPRVMLTVLAKLFSDYCNDAGLSPSSTFHAIVATFAPEAA